MSKEHLERKFVPSIQQLRTRDEAALTVFVKGMTPELNQIARRRAGEQDAMDAVQDFWVRFLSRTDVLTTENLPGYAMRGVHNAAINRLRERNIREGKSDSFLNSGKELGADGRQPSVETEAIGRVVVEELENIIFETPMQPEQREALLLKANGLSQREIAAVQQTEPATGGTRLHRARERVRPKVLAYE